MIKKLIISIIRVYQMIISPWFPGCCRYHPTCSEYMICAIKKYGIIYGTVLGVKRLLSCHPFSKKSNVDPI